MINGLALIVIIKGCPKTKGTREWASTAFIIKVTKWSTEIEYLTVIEINLPVYCNAIIKYYGNSNVPLSLLKIACNNLISNRTQLLANTYSIK